ncbi:MAG: hypothetical protein LBC64_01885 [Fibromonadaceae bacterium]|jgi:hypothetical protein|nr:hypothetical protein [Fibromonadaceae bacterium]
MISEAAAINEVSAAIHAVDGAWNLQEQTRPIEQYYDLPKDDFPLAIVYIDGEVYNQVANDRFEISLNFRISLAYKYNKGEDKKDALERGKASIRKIYRKIKERQTSGEAEVAFYDYVGIKDIRAVNNDTNSDGNDEICIVTGEITFNQLEFAETKQVPRPPIDPGTPGEPGGDSVFLVAQDGRRLIAETG